MPATETLSLDDHRLDLRRRLSRALKANDAEEVYRFMAELLSLEAEGS